MIKKYYILFLILVVVVFYLSIRQNNYTFYTKPLSFLSSNKSNILNIFFVESNEKRFEFTNKELCAIESAAFNNPFANIYIYSINTKFKNLDLRIQYKNIIFKKLDLKRISKGTILENFWNEEGINKSPHKIAHTADAIRLLLLWNHGGIYSDLDTISIKNFGPLKEFNAFGFVHPDTLGNGFISFKKKHRFLYETLNQFVKNYRPNEWSTNGPLLICSMIQKYCTINGMEEVAKNILLSNDLTNSFNSLDKAAIQKHKNIISQCDINLFPEWFVYSYKWNEAGLFDKNGSIDIKRFINTFSVHFYGKMSEGIRIYMNDNSIYEYFAKKNCQVTYNHVLKNKLSF